MPSPEVVEAGRLFDSGDYAGAARAYEALAKAKPQSVPLKIRLGASLQSQGKSAEALAILTEASKAGPNPNALAWTARAQSRLGKTEEALTSLKEAVKNGFIDLDTLDREADLASLRSDVRFKEIRATAERNAHPCAASAESAQFDFWVGDWDVTVGGVRAGQSHVEKILNGCIVFENWTGASGYVGKSFNLYDAQKKRWQQTWVDGVGGITEYFGEWKDGALRFQAKGTIPSGQTTPVDQTMDFYKLDDGRVRQFIQQTPDGGKTWSVVFDGIYARKR
jgi:tetratricopeptide (TPR) repeat protein